MKINISNKNEIKKYIASNEEIEFTEKLYEKNIDELKECFGDFRNSTIEMDIAPNQLIKPKFSLGFGDEIEPLFDFQNGNRRIKHLRLNGFMYLENPTIDKIMNIIYSSDVQSDLDGECIIVTPLFTIYYRWEASAEYSWEEFQVCSIKNKDSYKSKFKSFKRRINFEKYLEKLLNE